MKTVKTLVYKRETIYIEGENGKFSWRFKTIEIDGGVSLQPYLCGSIEEAVTEAKSIIDCLDRELEEAR